MHRNWQNELLCRNSNFFAPACTETDKWTFFIKFKLCLPRNAPKLTKWAFSKQKHTFLLRNAPKLRKLFFFQQSWNFFGPEKTQSSGAAPEVRSKEFRGHRNSLRQSQKTPPPPRRSGGKWGKFRGFSPEPKFRGVPGTSKQPQTVEKSGPPGSSGEFRGTPGSPTFEEKTVENEKNTNKKRKILKTHENRKKHEHV